jgi:predicted NBD/HSP70 family sugar kinase
MENGVVQGAVLTVTLFLIAMADIVKEIKETCTILGYANDWVIVISSKAPIRAETRIKKAANNVTWWAPEKTKTMLSHETKETLDSNLE